MRERNRSAGRSGGPWKRRRPVQAKPNLQSDRPAVVPAAPPIQEGDVPDNIFGQLIPEIRSALSASGYRTPTPVQAQCIPHLLKGRDLLGSAQTGTGKTAAFTLPLLQYIAQNPARRIQRSPRVLILAPTRELAAQIGESIQTYGAHLPIRHTVIFGGVGQRPQEIAMSRGVDFLVATPGRLLDLMGQGFVSLDSVEAFVLDEADRMLDMGFIRDIRKIIDQLPSQRHSLFFSATFSKEIETLANTMLERPARVTIAPEKPTVERIDQKVMFVNRDKKDALLVSLLKDSGVDKVIVFTQQKHAANKVADRLERSGIRAAAIHGNKSQGARTKALEGFKVGKVRVLVATDIAARGIDVDGVTHVINYHLPMEPETYVHRIGRTARAGADGDAVSFCSAPERDQLRDIERLIRKQITSDETHDFHSEEAKEARGADARPAPRGRGKGGGQGGSRASRGPRSGRSSSSGNSNNSSNSNRGRFNGRSESTGSSSNRSSRNRSFSKSGSRGKYRGRTSARRPARAVAG